MKKGANIEIVDPTSDGSYLLPAQVLVNGVDVGLIAKNGVDVRIGDRENFTEVSLTLLASRVTIRGPEEAKCRSWRSYFRR